MTTRRREAALDIYNLSAAGSPGIRGVSAFGAGGVGAVVSSFGTMRIDGRSTHSPDRQTMK